jgi:hypothetical protein
MMREEDKGHRCENKRGKGKAQSEEIKKVWEKHKNR